MAENVTLAPLATLQNSSIIATINANNLLIETAFADCVSLAGTAPNAMLSNLDMNGFNILNLPAPSTILSPVRVTDILSGTTVNIPAGVIGTNTGDVNSQSVSIPGFSGTFISQNVFNSTYTPTHSDYRMTLYVDRTETGSGGSPGGAQDLGAFITNGKLNYLTSTVAGDNGALYLTNTQGINGDAACLQAASFKTYISSNHTSGNIGSQISSSWNDSSGRILQQFQVENGWNTANTTYPTGGVGVASESWGATPAVAGSQIIPYALYYGGCFDAFSNGATNPPYATNFLVASNARSTGHEYFRIIAGLNEAGTIVMGSPSAHGIDGTTSTLSGGTQVTLSNQSGNFFINNNVAVFTTGVIATAGYAALQNVTAISAGSSATPVCTFSSTANFGIYFGSGIPSFSAAQGSLYIRSDGGASTRLYSNTAGSTGWSAITSA